MTDVKKSKQISTSQIFGPAKGITTIETNVNTDAQKQTGGGVDSPIAAVSDPDKDDRYINTSEAANTTEYNLGEQDAAGGTTPVNETASDVGEMHSRVNGTPDTMEVTDPDKDQINSAAIIDKAEELNRTG